MSKLVRHIEVCRDQLEALYPQGIPEELTQTLDKLTRAAQRQHRQTEALVKLSDATEAKLTQTNDALESLTQNLSRYVPQTVVDLLLDDHTEDDFSRSSRRDITAFFSDVVGFTSMAERLEPEQLSELLSDYFTEMSRIVERWGGTLDQFIGDAIVVFLGAPSTKGINNDAVAALSMAFDMQEQLSKLRLKWQNDGFGMPLHVRMGLASGYCNVGNFGSEKRLHYTAIGNAMNEAARVQGLCKPDRILISEECYKRVSDSFECQQLDEVELKGRSHATKIYLPRERRAEGRNETLACHDPGFRLFLDSHSIKNKKMIEAQLKRALKLIEDN